ncbi:MAG: DICT sensory domain-containing protein [Anaerolineales bacterium]
MKKNDILSTFYHNLLPLFQPQTEGYLQNLKQEDLQNASFRYIFSVAGMTEISHMIEDAVIETRGISDTHVSFQYFSRITAQIDQYKKVAETSKSLWLYGIPDAQLPQLPRTTGIDTSGTPLEKYWFVVAYGPGIYATLLAEEIAPENDQRLYEGFYTFEPETAYQVIAILHQMFPAQIPAPITPIQQG